MGGLGVEGGSSLCPNGSNLGLLGSEGVLGYAMHRLSRRWSDPVESRMRASDTRGRSGEEARSRSRTEVRWERLFGRKVWAPTGGET